MKLGEIIRAYRAREGLAQQDLADALGVTASQIGHIEGGRSSMRSDQIGMLREAYPELWKQLASVRLAEERELLGLDNGEAISAPEAVLSTLKAIRSDIDQEIAKFEARATGKRNRGASRV